MNDFRNLCAAVAGTAWDSASLQAVEAEPIKCGLPASNDGELTPEDVEAEVRRIEADEHYNELKRTGQLEARRVAYAHRNDDPWSRSR